MTLAFSYIWRWFIFSYANFAAVNVALDVLSKDITSKKIPDQHGKSGSVSYDVKGLVNVEFLTIYLTIWTQLHKG